MTDTEARSDDGLRVTIEGIRAIVTQPAGIPLVVVRVDTSEAGLYGLGCATFTQRAHAVRFVVEEYLTELLVGRDPDRIEDIWQLVYGNAYWRNGPVLNNALSGVDMALWDIKGKRAGMPLYQLFGGACREGAPVYRHADGQSPEEVAEHVRRYMEEGYRYVRAQLGGYGGRYRRPETAEAFPGSYFDPHSYALSVPRLFEHLRSELGFEVQLLHDVHERLAPPDAIRLAKELERYRLFFLEDPLPPEGIEWFQELRQQAATPIAMGELFNHPREWRPLITGRLIDFIRMHISQMGGITPARKAAALAEAFQVRTAWHGPGDVSPVGHAANLHLDLAVTNFGVQEVSGFSEVLQEVFPGCPELRDGRLYPNDRPGLGIDCDEERAADFPVTKSDVIRWTQTRLPDGTLVRA